MATPTFVNPALVAVNNEVARVAISVNESKLHLEQIDGRISGTQRELSLLIAERNEQRASHKAVLEFQSELVRGKELLEEALEASEDEKAIDEADLTVEDDLNLEEL